VHACRRCQRFKALEEAVFTILAHGVAMASMRMACAQPLQRCTRWAFRCVHTAPLRGLLQYMQLILGSETAHKTRWVILQHLCLLFCCALQ
jgi:hypothetical protein